MTITTTFNPPLPSDSPSVFNTKAFTLLGDLNDWSAEANALASGASTDASTATTQASSASTSAGTATTQAGIATTQAGIATTKAGEANSSAIAAAASAASVVDIATTTHAATSKTTPVDADELPLSDSAATYGLKKLTWANLKATAKTYFDTLYLGITATASDASQLLGSTWASPPAIGSTTPAAGAFTTLTSTGVSSVSVNSASAALTVTQTGTGNSFVVEDSASTDATPFVIDGAGLVGVGVITSFANNKFTVAGGTDASSWMVRNTADGVGYEMRFIKNRNTNVYANTIVNSGDTMGSISFAGNDGANALVAASISADVDATPGTNDMPGRLVFSTTADGASSPTERMRIDSAGNVGIGGAATISSLFSSKGLTGGESWGNVRVQGAVQSDVTNLAWGFDSVLLTQAASFTLNGFSHYRAEQATIGAGSAVTSQMGFSAESSLTGATNNYGFYGNIPAAAGRYNFYAAGTAQNIFNGDVLVTGAAAALGYGTGSGGTVTQATSKTTAVTLNKPTGQITMNNASLAAGEVVTFTLNNSLLGVTKDILVTNIAETVASKNYSVSAGTGSGAATINLRNESASPLAESVVIQFAIIKGATA